MAGKEENLSPQVEGMHHILFMVVCGFLLWLTYIFVVEGVLGWLE